MGSCGKGIKNGQGEEEHTGTLSESVNKQKSVNSKFTLTKFTYDLQRISEKHRYKAEIIAREHNRRSFNEVLDVYEFCYDFVRELSIRLGVPLHKVPEEVDKFLPQDEVDVISFKITELLDEINLNGNTRRIIEPLL